jgi:signal transduction histidine kinase
MSLAEFIKNNNERILQEWEQFAGKISGSALPRWILRDHGTAILKSIAERMETPSPPVQERLVAAAEGEASSVQYVTAAHVKLRIDSGFDLAQIIAEYVVLRACVVRLWREGEASDFKTGAAELTRFAEVVDENSTAAVVQYKERETEYRDRFIGILGHDLRNPINVITLAATALEKLGLTEEQLKMVGRIENNARLLAGMASDILDFARGRLGSPMPITTAPVDMGVLVREVVDSVQSLNPGCVIELGLEGDLKGDWDVERLKQVVSNLVVNAIQHGTGTEVQVKAKSDESFVVVQVHNAGPAIPEDLLATIFDPLVRGPAASRNSTGAGLGLFIVSEIVSSHLGTIAVTSTQEAGTSFIMRLPRGPARP